MVAENRFDPLPPSFLGLQPGMHYPASGPALSQNNQPHAPYTIPHNTNPARPTLRTIQLPRSSTSVMV